MVAIARRAWPGARFRQGDAHTLPFPDRSFDAVTSGFAILHLGRPERAVAEMVRVLVPGGRVAVTVWDQPERVPLLGAVAAALATCGADVPDDIPAGPPFFRFSQDDELRGLLAGRGLGDVTVETVRFVHEVRDAGVVWDGIMEGTVRTVGPRRAPARGNPSPDPHRLRRAPRGLPRRLGPRATGLGQAGRGDLAPERPEASIRRSPFGRSR